MTEEQDTLLIVTVFKVSRLLKSMILLEVEPKHLVLLKKENTKKFECKPRTTTFPFLFNGFWVDKHDSGGYILHQNDYCSGLKK